MPSPHSSPLRLLRRGGFLLAGTVLAGLIAGCATPSAQPGDTLRSLRRIPRVSTRLPRTDQALIEAFFAANGVRLTPDEIETIVPPAALHGRISRPAIRRIAAKHDRLVIVVKADETVLWEELGRNLPLLVLLPADLRYSPVTTPLIPVAWDRNARTINLLDGTGAIRTLPETEFFTRRNPLKQAALCLTRPGGFRQFTPTRKQKLLLADFWFDKGFYRRAGAVYEDIDQIDPDSTDVDALVGQGNILVRKGRCAEAVPFFEAALTLEPDNPRILNNLAYAMLKGNGELLVALRHARKANRLDPGNPLILETIGSINLNIGDAEAAAKYLEQAWAHSLEHPPETQIYILDQLIRAWLAADRQDLAWQVAEYRQRTFPNYKFPKDILLNYPSFRLAPVSTD